ncbi:caspase family protein [Streptomyces sp. O3]
MTDRALLVGIDVYPDPVNNLNSCVADTRAMRDILVEAGFDTSGIRVLLDADATLAAARQGLEWLVDGAQQGDRRVFFQSSHGYRYDKDGVMTEVLCCYDAFLEDTELVARTRGLPPGVLTVAIDSCHSGGMEKEFTPGGMARAVRTKVFIPPREKLLEQTKSVERITGMKPFGRRALRDENSLSKGMSLSSNMAAAAKGPGGVEVELNGVLLTASRPDQTAAAGSPSTDGLSAFTYALAKELDATAPVAFVHDRVVARLDALGMSQTPCLFAPSEQEDRLAEPFLAKASSGIRGTIEQLEELLRQVAAGGTTADKTVGASTTHGPDHSTKVKDMTTVELEKSVSKATQEILAGVKSAGGTKVWGGPVTPFGDIQRCCAGVAPAVLAAMSQGGGAKGYAVDRSLADPTLLMDKGFWSSAISIARTVGPVVLQALTKSGDFGEAKPPDPAALRKQIEERVPAHRMGDDKFLSLVGTLASIAAPMIIDAVTKDFQPDGQAPTGTLDLDLPQGMSEAEQKGFLSDAFNVAVDVLPHVIRAVQKV